MPKPIEKEKPSNYLQNRILLLILVFIAILGIILASLSSYLYKHYLQKSLLLNADVNLQFLTDSIDNNINNVKKLVFFCQNNSTILNFAENGNTSRALSLRAYERLNEEFQASEADSYLHRVIVASNTGSYLQLVPNTYSSSQDSFAVATALPYFSELLEAKSYSFSTGLVQDSFYTGQIPTNVLPILRPIYARYNAAYNGWVMIYVSDSLFTDSLAYYNLPEDSQLYLTLGEHSYQLTRSGCVPIESDFSIERPMETDFLTSGTQANYVRTDNSGREFLMITKSFDQMPGCYISQSISPKELNTQRTLFLTAVSCMILLIVIIGMIVSYLLYRTISIPVLKLRDKVASISQGNFSRDTSIEWNHELGDIGRGINDMSESISELLNHRLEDEKQKRDLEYKMLQSQINPHFIYNTLNSIKWMATVQGSDGIAEMTTSLSRLLRSISKGTKLLVPLREELALLNDYFTIQQYRYGGTITMNITVAEEALYDCQIVKFTLQPLVENAIFHGIEPKGSAGTIDIIIEEKNDGDIQVVVSDDGVGMSEEKAKRLLSDDSDRSADFFRELGVSNVHKRLQYEFGSGYGITVDSKEGEYTRMILLLPKQIQR